jgi:hypothetical protein
MASAVRGDELCGSAAVMIHARDLTTSKNLVSATTEYLFEPNG